MYLEHLHLNRAPFLEELDPNCFFPDAGRKILLQTLFQKIRQEHPLIKITGREGSGKTLLCQVFVKWLPDEYEIVSLDNPVYDFDDLMRLVCLDLGMNPAKGQERADCSEALLALLQKKKETGKKVILLIDEAEKLFMATLERLIHFAATLPPHSAFSIVLIGRPGLDVNLEHILASGDGIKTLLSYTLQDLHLEETREYLGFRMQAAGLKDPAQFNKIFPESVINKIHSTAQGNIRMINILAEESLQVSFSQKSFMVLLDKVAAGTDSRLPHFRKQGTRAATDRSTLHKRIAIAMIACLIIGGAAFFLLRGQGEESISKAPQQGSALKNNQGEAPASPVAAGSAPLPGDDADDTEDSLLTPEEALLLADMLGHGNGPLIDLEDLDINALSAPVGTAPALPPKETAGGAGDDEKKISTDDLLAGTEAKEKSDQEIDPGSPLERLDDTDTTTGLVTTEALRTGSPVATQQSSANAHIAPDKTMQQHDPVAPPVSGRKQVALAAPKTLSGADIVRERQQAGDEWLRHPRENVYTLQLMHLTSAQAIERLAELLAGKNYYPIRNQFYIVQKKHPAQGFFLFYGTYGSREAVRKAREDLPDFLQEHQPYPLSISDAVRKASQ